MPLVNVAKIRIDDRARERIPQGLLESTPCLPIGVDGDITILAVSDPTVIPEIHAAWKNVPGRIEIVLTTFTALWAAYRAEIEDSSFWGSISELTDLQDETTSLTLKVA